jgi:hypothetical protein
VGVRTQDVLSATFWLLAILALAWHYEVAVMLLSHARVEEAIVPLNETLRDPSDEGARQTLAALAK